jgi:beta-mannosidase
VRFAAECLPLAAPDGSCSDPEPDRAAGIPRDRNQDWDFLDVTDRYRPAALAAEAEAQLRSDLARRITVAHVVQETLATWRSSLTPTRGAITISHRDGAPGSGWGLLDACGRPKAGLLAAAPVTAPVAVLILEDGLNGIRLEIVNDGSRAVAGSLELTAWTTAATPGATGSCRVRVPPRGRTVLDAETVLGQFLDLAHAWKFGPRGYLLLTATLEHATGPVRAARVIGGPLPPLHRTPRLDARLLRLAPEEWMIEITADAPAPWCHVDLSTPHRVGSGWQHAAPGHPVTVVLQGAGAPRGVAHAPFATAVAWTRSAAA